jgi:hypothetical protein
VAQARKEMAQKLRYYSTRESRGLQFWSEYPAQACVGGKDQISLIEAPPCHLFSSSNITIVLVLVMPAAAPPTAKILLLRIVLLNYLVPPAAAPACILAPPSFRELLF